MKFGTVTLCHVLNKVAKKKIQNSNYSCDDNVTNFVKFMKKMLK